MKQEYIQIYGARTHNLKNIDIKIPRNKIVVFTGKSGSGKSSLAFDTIHAEGQRRYLETLSPYARQFLGNNEKPEVDKITGLSPVVSIEQKTTNKNPRSTVGTITEIYDYLRLLFARIGTAYSYNTNEKMIRFSHKEIINLVKKEFNGQQINILAPIIRNRKGHYKELFVKILKKGYLRVRIDGEIQEIVSGLKLDRYKKHDIEIIIDKLTIKKENHKRLISSVRTALKDGNGVIMILNNHDNIRYLSQKLMCPSTGIAYDDPEPNSFSFNSPRGACSFCNGLGFHHKANVNKIIPNKDLSIQQGAIQAVENADPKWFLKQIEIIGQKFNFSLKTPIKDIKPEGLDAILYGINEKIPIKLKNFGGKKNYDIKFQGIINFIEDQSNLSYAKKIERWAKKYMSEYTCESCKGSRINIESSHYKIYNQTIQQLSSISIDEFYKWLNSIEKKMNNKESKISKQIIKELKERTRFILNLGLGYLTLNRGAKTLSGGESQRIRLATQIGSELTNVLYILDEPSIGLHQRDNEKLIKSLKKLKNIGNSIIIVEHDKRMIMESDYVIDLGPEAGEYGGEIIAAGSINEILRKKTITSEYLNGTKEIDVPEKRRKGNGKSIILKGAQGNNLKSVNITIPLGILCCVTGVSGSGKSTLINKTLYPILNNLIFNSLQEPLKYKEIIGTRNIDKIIEVNQSPIGKSPRSNPATYISVFSAIRDLYSSLPESKIRGYKVGRFSFNVSGGRCEECKGSGMKTIEMNFLPDVFIHCDICNGKRYNRETLEIKYKGKSISDVLEMTVDNAVLFFRSIPLILRKIKTLQEVGLGYLKLGQSSKILSGGESQRVKLSAELAKKNTGRTLYILDEPTTGLHFEDIKILLSVLQKIIDQGNTVIIIEHNMDVIKRSDFIIDLGPEGGENGGHIICNGTPEEIVKQQKGYTAKYLAKEL